MRLSLLIAVTVAIGLQGTLRLRRLLRAVDVNLYLIFDRFVCICIIVCIYKIFFKNTLVFFPVSNIFLMFSQQDESRGMGWIVIAEVNQLTALVALN